MLKNRRFRLTAITISIMLGLLILLFAGVELWITLAARPYVYEDISNIPEREVGVVLGTSKYVATGRPNLYFNRRMQAAADLFHAGKINTILVSGSNPSKHYNEPRDMYQALHELGVPKNHIEMDFAGFRTLDSVVRARKVFGLEEYTLITDRFHVKRSVFLGRSHGADVIAYPAQDVPLRLSLRTRLRERVANIKALLDVYLFNTQPKYLGDPVDVTDEPGKREHLEERQPGSSSSAARGARQSARQAQASTK
jgi:SanA protein